MEAHIPPIAFGTLLFMSTQVATATLTNGINGVNGAGKKIKSKNQLRRLKAKQKKVEERDKSETPVRSFPFPSSLVPSIQPTHIYHAQGRSNQ